MRTANPLRHRVSLIALPVVLLLAGAFAPPAAAQSTDHYAAQTAETLAELGIPESQVKSIKYALKYNPQDRGPSIIGAKAWVRLTTCSGYLVVDMRRTAYVLQAYTEGDCRIEGVKAY